MLKFYVVSESINDFQHVTDLGDRVLLDRIGWLRGDPELLSTQLEWNSRIDHIELLWSKSRDWPQKRRSSVHGHFNGTPGAPDAHQARKAILFITGRSHDVSAILLIRDADREGSDASVSKQRRTGLEQARNEHTQRSQVCAVVIGVADKMRECWVIAGFEPENDSERARLNNEKNRLHFDPVPNSHELHGQRETLPKSPKRVLNSLCGGDVIRERQCWIATKLDTLKANGRQNGLSSFLSELEQFIVPLVQSSQETS